MPPADHRNRSTDLFKAWLASEGPPLTSSSRPVSNLQLPRPKFGSLELPQLKFGNRTLCDRDSPRIIKAMDSTRKTVAMYSVDLIETYKLVF